jgi:hypothetical protein
MKIISVQGRVSLFLIAVVLLLQLSPALATGQADTQQAAIQGSRVPGIHVPSTKTARNRHGGHVDVTFTKWITTSPLMEGFTGGDIPGKFAGEVLQRQVSRDGRIIRLEAIYEVQSGQHSFTALIRGGTGETKSGEPASVSGAALLDGFILAGWRTGARVHVEFQTMTNCVGAPDARTCFEGTIRIGRAPEK